MGRHVGRISENKKTVSCSCVSSCPFLTPFSSRLHRVYILFNAKHGLNPYDKAMLAHLSNLMLTLTSTPHRQTPPWTIQSVITKADTIPVDQISPMINQLKQDIHKTAPLCLRPIVTSAEMKPPWNIDQLRANIMDACGIGRLVL